jgi:anti-sigma28 factor (negative regulator of flagellin synthesis)
MKENTTYLYLASTTGQGSTSVSIECDDRKTHQGSQESRALAHGEALRDEREAYLAALDTRIRSGTYQIDCHATAEQILQQTGQFYLEYREWKIGEMSE